VTADASAPEVCAETALEVRPRGLARLSDDSWLRAHPGVSAGVAAILCLTFDTATLFAASAGDVPVAVLAYVAAFAAGLFGAFEFKRAGQGVSP